MVRETFAGSASCRYTDNVLCERRIGTVRTVGPQQVPDSEVPVRQNEFKEMVGDLEAGGQFIEDHSEQAHGKYICRIT